MKKGDGRLISIGGGEDKQGRRRVLKEVVAAASGEKNRLVIITAATQIPEEYLAGYLPVFEELGMKHVDVLDVRERTDVYEPEALKTLRGACAVFFTGGSQRRIASLIGGSPVEEALRDLYARGATIAGTSAGAAAMPETMLVAGASDESPDLDDVNMAPGLGLMPGVVIDSHFAERGRIGRLLAAVAQNPRNLGLGIDEDTAVVVEGARGFHVVGSGAVYVVDGTQISFSSLERRSRGGLSVYGVRLHVLRDGEEFEWEDRRPLAPASRTTA